MANLLGQNIGTNYKGILNLNTLNGNLTTTLEAITDGDGNASPLTLSTGEVGISRTIALSAGSSNVRLINETYTINNSGAQTGTATGIFLNATETALNGMGHNLMDLQVGGVSRFRVFNSGGISANGVYVNGTNRAFITSPSDSIILLYNSGGDNFNRLQLGGTTNAFPAIKRNGAAIDFRLADDSAFANINTGQINVDNFSLVVQSSVAYFQYNLLVGASGANNTSAALEVRSTTKGFLPPRMTTTQRDAIASPAAGLVIYNTTTNVLNFYNGSAWGAV